MKVCYFGDYNPEYARNRVLLRGLRLNGVGVIECQTSLEGRKAKKDLLDKWKKIEKDFDCVIVGYSDSRWVVPLIKFLTKKPIIWDAFYSLYDSWIFDKKLRSPISLHAWYYWWLDYRSCRLADLVLLDTKEQIKYFTKTFLSAGNKFQALPVGTDDVIFNPKSSISYKKDEFVVFFLGKFIPLQGVEYIVKAASILGDDKEIKFRIVGRGQTYDKVKEISQELGVENIEFINPIAYTDIPDYIARADICLGIFGDSDKTLRVIPNKVYEAVAMKKPVISSDTPAIRELFIDRKSILLCQRSDPKDIAEKILLLKKDKTLRNNIASGGYEVYLEKASPKVIGKELINILEDVCK